MKYHELIPKLSENIANTINQFMKNNKISKDFPECCYIATNSLILVLSSSLFQIFNIDDDYLKKQIYSELDEHILNMMKRIYENKRKSNGLH